MVTFGFSVIAATLSSQFDSITQGINGYTTTTLVPKGYPFYLLVVLFALTSISVMYFIMKSRMGLAFRAIHGNEAEAKMIGINTAKYKLLAFVISTFFAGIAGGLNAYFIRLIDNSIFSPANSFLPLIMTVIGGLGTVAGPIIGSIFLVSIQQILALPSVVESFNGALGSYFPKRKQRWTTSKPSIHRRNPIRYRDFCSKRLGITVPQNLQLLTSEEKPKGAKTK